MDDRLKATLLSASHTAFNVLSKLFVNKVLAIYAGPAGYTLVSQLQNLLATVNAMSTAGLSTGLVSLTAKHSNDSNALMKTWKGAAIVALFMNFLIIFTMLAYKNELSVALFGSENFSFILQILCVAMPFTTVCIMLNAFLSGKKDYTLFTVSQIIMVFLSALSVCISAVYGDINYILASLIIYQLFYCIILLSIFTKKYDYISNLERIKLFLKNMSTDRKTLKTLLPYAYMTICTSLIGPLAFTVLRQKIIVEYDILEAGYWDAVMRMSSLILLFVSAPLSMYFIPKVSETSEKTQIFKEFYVMIGLGLPIISLGLLILFYSQSYWIPLLFSNEFMGMSKFLGYQFFGEIFRAINILFSFYFLAKAMTLSFISMELVFYSTYLAITYYMIYNIGLTESVSISYCVSCMLVSGIYALRVWNHIR